MSNYYASIAPNFAVWPYADVSAYNASNMAIPFYPQGYPTPSFPPLSKFGPYPHVHSPVDFAGSRKRKRETRHATDFTIRGILGLSDDEDDRSCDSSSTLSSNEYYANAQRPYYSLPEADGALDFLHNPAKRLQLCCTPPAQDYFPRYEPVSPVTAETVVSSTYDAYAPNESDNASVPTRATCSPTFSSSMGPDDSSSSPARKSKRVRTIFTPQQLEKLEKEFEKTQYMVGVERVELAAELKLSESQVKVWFQNRRIKERKQTIDTQKAALSKLKEDEESCGRLRG